MKPTTPRHITVSRESIASVTGTGTFVNPEANTLKTEVSFIDRRGYAASILPVKTEELSESFLMFGGKTVLLESAPRFNAKRLADHARTVLRHPAYLAARTELITTHGITLADAAAAA